MTKIKFFIAALLLQCLCTSQGWTQLLPPMEAEKSAMPGVAEVVRPVGTFAYSFEDVSFYGSSQNLYLTSWSQTSYSGFHWRRATTVSVSPFIENTTDEGVIQITGASPSAPAMFYSVEDLSAVLIQDNSGTVFIVATFYGLELSGAKGHYAQMYKWHPGGVDYAGTIPLSASPVYGRISVDAHRMYGISIVWEEAAKLYMKGIETSSGGFNVGPSLEVPLPYRGFIPDIAFSHTDALRARVVYIAEGTSYPTVIHIKFDELMMASPSFALDDVNTIDPFPNPLPMYTGGSSSATALSYPHGENLKIDCPDHSSEDTWAYVYTADRIKVKVRGRYGSAPPVTQFLTASLPDLSAGFFNQQVAIQYNRSGRIYSGWRSNYAAFAPGQRYVGKIFDLFSPIPPVYSIISNESAAFTSIAFSKQDDRANCLFATYTYHGMPLSSSPTGYDIMYKLKPYSTGVFFSEVKTMEDVSVTVSPNPFTESIRIDYQGDPARLFNMSVTNSVGQVVLSGEGEMTALQNSVDRAASSWPAGYYIFSFQETAGEYSETIKVVKH